MLWICFYKSATADGEEPNFRAFTRSSLQSNYLPFVKWRQFPSVLVCTKNFCFLNDSEYKSTVKATVPVFAEVMKHTHHMTIIIHTAACVYYTLLTPLANFSLCLANHSEDERADVCLECHLRATVTHSFCKHWDHFRLISNFLHLLFILYLNNTILLQLLMRIISQITFDIIIYSFWIDFCH